MTFIQATTMRLKNTLVFLCIIVWGVQGTAQETICINKTLKHTIQSKHLKENRAYWVSLPLKYSDSFEVSGDLCL